MDLFIGFLSLVDGRGGTYPVVGADVYARKRTPPGTAHDYELTGNWLVFNRSLLSLCRAGCLCVWSAEFYLQASDAKGLPGGVRDHRGRL